MNILGILITVAFLLWMPLSLIILWLIYRGQQALMQETLVTITDKVMDNTHDLAEARKRLVSLEGKDETRTRSENDVLPQ